MFAQGAQQILGQQFIQGCSIGQQALVLEMSGNVQSACQFYDQAAAMLTNCVSAAQQYMVPVSDQGWFSVAWCHFNAARTKTMLGWGMAAPAHLSQAQVALNNAITINPYCGPYYSALGILLAASGQAGPAIQAFAQAVNLNPADAFSQYMLALLNQAQGNYAAGSQHFGVAQQYVPNLPPPTQALQHQGGSSASKGLDINGLIGTVGEVAKLFNTASSLFSNLGGSEGSGGNQAWDGGQNWGNGGNYGW